MCNFILLCSISQSGCTHSNQPHQPWVLIDQVKSPRSYSRSQYATEPQSTAWISISMSISHIHIYFFFLSMHFNIVDGKPWRTCPVELRGPPEEARQRRLQHHHKVLQLLRDSHQQVFIHQVVLGLLQRPLAARVPAQRSQQNYPRGRKRALFFCTQKSKSFI